MIKCENNYSLHDILIRSIPDLVRISIQCNVAIPNYVDPLEKPKVGRFSTSGSCYLSPAKAGLGRVQKIDYFHRITSSINFRGQYELRKLVLNKLNRDRMPDAYWEENTNCLSNTVYDLLRNSGVSLQTLKTEVYNKLDEEIQNRIIFIEKAYFSQFGRGINKSKVKIFLKKVEISTDIESPTGYEMARDLTFKRQFNEVIHSIGFAYFKDKYKHAVAKPGAEVKSGTQLIKQLNGYLPKKVILKVYLKSKDKKGWLNRLESVYRDNSLDQVLIYGRQLSEDPNMPYIGLKYVLRKLTRIHAKRVHRILKHKPLSRKPKLLKLIKISLKSYCGSYWDDIYQSYKQWGVVSTGRGTQLPKTACRTITRLARQGILFKKIKHPRATYRILRSLMVKNKGQF